MQPTHKPRCIAFLSAFSLLSILCASNVWGFTGEACGRYADDYDYLRWCQAELEVGAIEEVATRTGELRHGSGQDWYLESTDPQGETLWVDTRRLSDAEASRLATQCCHGRCWARLTGVVRDRMISLTAFEMIEMPQ